MALPKIQVSSKKKDPFPHSTVQPLVLIRLVVNEALYSQFGHAAVIWPTASQSETSSWNWTGHLNGTYCLYMKKFFSETSTIQNFKTHSSTSLKTQSGVGCRKKYASWSSPRLACECRYDFHNGRHDMALLMKVQEAALAEPRNRICYYK